MKEEKELQEAKIYWNGLKKFVEEQRVIEVQQTKEWKEQVEWLMKELDLDKNQASIYQTARWFANKYCQEGRANELNDMIEKQKRMYELTNNIVFEKIRIYLTNMLVMNF